MGSFDPRAASVDGSKPSAPSTCPTCQSPSIVTTARIPDSNSYWRCQSCARFGTIRRGMVHSGGNRWR